MDDRRCDACKAASLGYVETLRFGDGDYTRPLPSGIIECAHARAPEPVYMIPSGATFTGGDPHGRAVTATLPEGPMTVADVNKALAAAGIVSAVAVVECSPAAWSNVQHRPPPHPPAPVQCTTDVGSKAVVQCHRWPKRPMLDEPCACGRTKWGER